MWTENLRVLRSCPLFGDLWHQPEREFYASHISSVSSYSLGKYTCCLFPSLCWTREIWFYCRFVTWRALFWWWLCSLERFMAVSALGIRRSRKWRRKGDTWQPTPNAPPLQSYSANWLIGYRQVYSFVDRDERIYALDIRTTVFQNLS